MSSNVFFSPRPQPQPKRTGSTNNLDRNAFLFSRTWNEQSAMMTPSPPPPPLRQTGSKTPFGFKSATPLLFATPSSSSPPRSLPFSPIPISQKGKRNEDVLQIPSIPPSRKPNLGYLAFPAGSPPSFSSSSVSSSDKAAAVTDGVAVGYDGLSRSGARLFGGSSNGVSGPTKPNSSSDPRSASTSPCTTSNGSSAHQSRSPLSRVIEQAEAERGEEEWVSRGGVLRDRFGNVDAARTKKVREEVERKEREKVLKERWEAYEEGWRKLVERCGGPGYKGKAKAKDNGEECNDAKDIGFNDIPWPVWVEDCIEEKPRFAMSISITHSPNGGSSRPSFISGKNKNSYTLQDLTTDRIEDFLISPLSVRGCIETPKSRIRRSYLRWHPDKLRWLAHRVKDEDSENVNTGVRTVLECLRKMNAKFRAHGNPVDAELHRSQPGGSSSASGSSPAG